MKNFVRKITGFESVDELESLAYSSLGPEEILLSKEAVLVMIDRFLHGLMSGTDLERIAEALDVNERIFVPGDERRSVSKAIFYISSTEINGSLSFDRIRLIRDDLLYDGVK